ncbi:hypothetical protein PA25_08300 [Pseudoalteromonas sp. A25]|uniref:hypothetical protein n=1 Tax=Pseudoalteromonas sp. A25 TaxID=116092 RepID=UPI00126080E6|nr:hypothetical protein [Pseudoalteromonas sp. A25]BBN80845.1 hypothetical protein PA25_08300 [Pseudoalteromonas sp. A25]
MLTLRFIIIASFLCALTAQALPHTVNTTPHWIEQQEDYRLQHHDSAHVTLDAAQQKRLFLPAGSGLTFSKIDEKMIQVWQAQTLNNEVALQLNTLPCKQDTCQIRALDFNRIITFSNQSEKQHKLTIWQNRHQYHPDPYNEFVPLPLEKTLLYQAHQYDTYYSIAAGQQISIPIKDAAKLKISVKNRLDNAVTNINNKIYVFNDVKPVSILPLSHIQAHEYEHQNVSITHQDYIAVSANSRLILKSFGDALVKVERSERAFLDHDSARKQQESFLNPYWINHLDPYLKDIYTQQGSQLATQLAKYDTSPLAQKRHQQLFDMVTKPRFLVPQVNSSDILSQRSTHSALLGVREANDHLYTMQGPVNLQTHRLKHQLHFSLSDIVTSKNSLTLYIKAAKEGVLTGIIGEQTLTIKYRASEQFSRIEINNITLSDSLTLTLEKTSEAIEVAVQVPELAPLISNELLYMQPGSLTDKSQVLAQQLLTLQQQTARSYMHALPTLNLESSQTSNPPHAQQLQILTQAQHSLYKDPLEALRLIKGIINSTHIDILLKAWALRIKALDKLEQQPLAQRYLEGLLKQSNAPLQEFAANALLLRYQQAYSDHKTQGLCANFSTLLVACHKLIPRIYHAQKKQLLALWHDHDNDNSSLREQDFPHSLNYQYLSTKVAPRTSNVISISHFGYTQLRSDTAQYQAIKLDPSKPLTLATKLDTVVQIKARVKASDKSQRQTHWLTAQTSDAQYLLPIFADIASQTVNEQNQRLSITASGHVELKANQTLRISSDITSYLDITFEEEGLTEAQTSKNSLSRFAPQLTFSTLLNDPKIDVKTLLNNALYRLENKALNKAQFNILFAKLKTTLRNHTDMTIFKRIEQFGHWQIIDNYEDYLGTQLIALQNSQQLSQAEQIARHSSKRADIPGILLRPYQSMSLDISQFTPFKNKLRISFSPSELGSEQKAKVTLEFGQAMQTYTIEANRYIEHIITDDNIQNQTVSIRWQQPFVSQLVSVELLEGPPQWQNVQLESKVRFYLASKQQPLRLKLKQDTLIKTEYFVNNQRKQTEHFYPAGVHTLFHPDSNLVRAFAWTLNPQNSKLPVYTNEQPKEHEKVLTSLVTKPSQHTETINTTTPGATHIEAYIDHSKRGRSDFEARLQAQQTTEVGALFRFKSHDGWYKFGVAKALSDIYYDTYHAFGRYDWLSPNSDWYANGQLHAYWQPSSTVLDDKLSSRLSISIGQRWKRNTQHTHQWWWQPHYFYSQANNETLVFDKLNPDILSQYKVDHKHGWRAGYQYWYQNYVDQSFSAKAQISSNQRWQELDNARLTLSARQFYQGHILELQLVGRYAFEDEHREKAQFQPLSRLDWYKRFAINHHYAAKLSVSFEKNWENNEHTLALQIGIGNLSITGFDVFSYAEQPFKTLSTLQLNEQVENE